MNVTDGKFAAKSGAKHTLFGLIGATRNYLVESPLSGLVMHTASGPKPSGLKKEKVADMTERHIGGKNASVVPGAHHGQIPYPGQYLYKKGAMLS
jgi:hypothetical protein